MTATKIPTRKLITSRGDSLTDRRHEPTSSGLS
jgi:hypothetical protein